MNDRFKLQADQYAFPYHYLVDLDAQTFGRTLEWGLDYYTYMRKALALAKAYLAPRILDVGCGDGFLLNHLMRDPALPDGVTALGVDLDEKPIKFAQAFGHGVPNLAFEVRDIATLEGAFGLVTCVETFEHIPDAALGGFIEHIDRLVEPGGTLLISVPSAVRAVIPKHYRHYTLPMLRAYFPAYDQQEVHYVTARKSATYQAASLLLSKRHVHLGFGPLKRALLALHERFSSDVGPEEGAHIVLVLRKPAG